jgi:hypothetical protein
LKKIKEISTSSAAGGGNGDEKTKRAILACLGSNLTISDKKIQLSYSSFFLSLIKAREAIEQEIENARTSKKPGHIQQKWHHVPLLSVRLRRQGSNLRPIA